MGEGLAAILQGGGGEGSTGRCGRGARCYPEGGGRTAPLVGVGEGLAAILSGGGRDLGSRVQGSAPRACKQAFLPAGLWPPSMHETKPPKT